MKQLSYIAVVASMKSTRTQDEIMPGLLNVEIEW